MEKNKKDFKKDPEVPDLGYIEIKKGFTNKKNSDEDDE
jgi:hypothetical protein